MIVLLFTGGTISMRHDAAAGGAIPSLSGKDILALAPGIDQIAKLEIDDWGAHPGPHMTVERMWTLRNRIVHHLGRPEVDGVVVTHGTDALEETAYLIARSVQDEKPVVVTGAMRTSSDLGWDGPGNLAAAVRVAASPMARGAGVLVVMSDRVFAAVDVTKAHTHALDAFESPGLGPLGVVDDGRVIFRRALPAPPAILAPTAPAEPVDIVYAFAGADSRLLDASRETGRAVVIAAMGRGNVPPAMVGGIERWIRDDKPVVITSRALRGRVGCTYGYPGGGRRLAELGAIFAGPLRPQQARIDVILALGAGLGVAEVRELLESL
ncbi:MAG: Asparaginase/glutaminase [Gemmatimonadetes bacterium]|nr:Asparaginase/glutaminase [Gemmatimonadota bacterium]